jgi:uncharacterized protein
VVDSAGMECRPDCGACCIAISITSPIPGMPEGKPAGVKCAQLTSDARCALFGLPARPRVCRDIRAEPDMCGSSREDALALIEGMEKATRPDVASGGEGSTAGTEEQNQCTDTSSTPRTSSA